MNRRIFVLGTVLVMQILLALGMNLGPRLVSAQTQGAILAFKTTDIDHIQIDDGKGHVVTLVRKGHIWHLPDYYDLAASSDGVQLLLNRLSKLESDIPVATTQDARKRFKVDPGSFERRIQLWHGKHKLSSVFIGLSSERNHSYLRVGGDSNIYDAPIALYELEDESGSWVDKDLLHLLPSSITEIKANGWVMKRVAAASPSGPVSSSVWREQGLPVASVLDQAAASRLADLIAQMTYDKVLGKTVKPDYHLNKPVLQLDVVHNGTSRQYRIGEPEDRKSYTLQVSDRQEIFKLQSYQIKPLLEAARVSNLLRKDAVKSSK